LPPSKPRRVLPTADWRRAADGPARWQNVFLSSPPKMGGSNLYDLFGARPHARHPRFLTSFIGEQVSARTGPLGLRRVWRRQISLSGDGKARQLSGWQGSFRCGEAGEPISPQQVEWPAAALNTCGRQRGLTRLRSSKIATGDLKWCRSPEHLAGIKRRTVSRRVELPESEVNDLRRSPLVRGCLPVRREPA
jgi:hypothetical protein